jgi:thiol-disulfide isomerase/thioredoxin
MQLSNGRYFSAADIPKGKPVLLIYFAPDCDHCHTLMNAFFPKATAFLRAQVVMVTHRPLAEVADFEKKFRTARFANIKVGTEGTTNFLRLFYKLQNTPFVALYDQEGKLVSSYRKDPAVDVLLQQLKQL